MSLSQTKSGKKSAALQALKTSRANRDQGVRVSRMEEYQIADEGDVFDELDENEYAEFVEKRRQREDFVVDDDGLGYHDDGEEHIGNDDVVNVNKARKRFGATANITAAALKRAKKDKAMFLQHGRVDDNDPSNGPSSNNTSMWNFVNVGPAAVALSGPSECLSSTQQIVKKTTGRGAKSAISDAELDALLSTLDREMPRSTASRSASHGSGRPHRTYGHVNRHAREHRYRSPISVQDVSSSGMSLSPTRTTPCSAARSAHQDIMDEPDARSAHQDIMDEPDAVQSNGDNDNDINFCSTVNRDENAATVHENEDNLNGHDSKPSHHKEGLENEPAAEDLGIASSEATASALSEKPIPPPRKTIKFAKPNSNRFAAPKCSDSHTDKAVVNSDSISERVSDAALVDKTVVIDLNTDYTSIQPSSIAAECVSSTISCVSAAAAADINLITETDEGGEKYLDMYWIDASEHNGDVHLYGKVEVPQEKASKCSTFVSCCAVIKNNQRSLFVLPRRVTDCEPEFMKDVYKEVIAVLQPSCIPLVERANIGTKLVTRQYAFDDPTVPREKTQYLKVIYDAKYPVPSREVCMSGGKYYEKILGAGASVLENFIIKRKLKGPCWIRIKSPLSSTSLVSWCKLELMVNSPKNVKCCGLDENGTQPRCSPPVVTVSIKFKTVTNPKSFKAEVVSASAICHKNVLLDTPSDESSELTTQISLIRPLGKTAASFTASLMPQFPRDLNEKILAIMPQLERTADERALLSRLFTQIGVWDPDVIVSHNAWGFDLEVLLTRCAELKVSSWSKIGRRRMTKVSKASKFSQNWHIAECVSGRLICDTYICSKEFLNETTYSLDNLAKTQLNTNRTSIEAVDVPQYFNESVNIVKLALHTFMDAQLVQRLMFKLQILPLTKQLTCLAGNLWGRTLKGNRAERTEYLLLHEFHLLKYIVPEKETAKHRKEALGEDVGKGAKYSGGLVLEPKKGLYNSFILLLDFNSLYPSIIQEYNLCFTTIDWSSYNKRTETTSAAKVSFFGNDMEGDENGDITEVAISSDHNIPPVPDAEIGSGILPRVITSLVERRRQVKKVMKTEKNAEKLEELDIRQKALKLTANSMYGCLGFSHSRFHAQPIAALVTLKGREILQSTVNISQETLGLEVVYGDTDSIMINTGITDINALDEVKRLGEKVKAEVNKRYTKLELEIDGVFRTMLLLMKKKYAAVTVKECPGGNVEFGREIKGLEMVRRDWCIQSKDTSRYVLDQILSNDDQDIGLQNIYNHLEEIATKMRNGDVPLERYVITKGLSKHPNDYPDAKSLPHVNVAKMMLKQNRTVNTGDHIHYVITSPSETDMIKDASIKSSSAADRARHPEEIQRSNGVLKPDVEWYIAQQILPPILRLCCSIAGTSQGLIAEKLGIDSSKYNQSSNSKSTADEIDDAAFVDYTPATRLPDEERFKDVEKFCITCKSCQTESEFPGVYRVTKDLVSGLQMMISGYFCTNASCMHPENWGYNSPGECVGGIMMKLKGILRRHKTMYYKMESKCSDPSCSLRTRQISIAAQSCLRPGCNGKMSFLYSGAKLELQIEYLASLFDSEHALKQLQQSKTISSHKEATSQISSQHKEMMRLHHLAMKSEMNKCASFFVGETFWKLGQVN